MANRVVKTLHKYSGLRRYDSLLICNIITISLKENTAFVKFFETLLGSDILVLFIDFQCLDTDDFGSI